VKSRRRVVSAVGKSIEVGCFIPSSGLMSTGGVPEVASAATGLASTPIWR
jgi:hypothetical protein